jgi:hypothetical protein
MSTPEGSAVIPHPWNAGPRPALEGEDKLKGGGKDGPGPVAPSLEGRFPCKAAPRQPVESAEAWTVGLAAARPPGRGPRARRPGSGARRPAA